MYKRYTRIILKNKSLGELDLAARIGVDVIAIRRRQTWIVNPDEEVTVIEDDVIVVRGAPQGVKKLENLASGTMEKIDEA